MSEVGRFRLNVVRIRPMLANLGPISTKFGPIQAKFDRTVANLASALCTSKHFGSSLSARHNFSGRSCAEALRSQAVGPKLLPMGGGAAALHRRRLLADRPPPRMTARVLAAVGRQARGSRGTFPLLTCSDWRRQPSSHCGGPVAGGAGRARAPQGLVAVFMDGTPVCPGRPLGRVRRRMLSLGAVPYMVAHRAGSGCAFCGRVPLRVQLASRCHRRDVFGPTLAKFGQCLVRFDRARPNSSVFCQVRVECNKWPITNELAEMSYLCTYL